MSHVTSKAVCDGLLHDRSLRLLDSRGGCPHIMLS